MRSTQPLLALVATALSACAAPREQTAGDDSGLAEVFERSLARRTDPLLRHLIDGRVYYYARLAVLRRLQPALRRAG